MPKQFITSTTAPTTGYTDLSTPSPLAQAIRFANMLFVSGQGPLDPNTREAVSGDIADQTKRTLDNLLHVLEAAGGAELRFHGPRFRFRASPKTLVYRGLKRAWHAALKAIYLVEFGDPSTLPAHFHPRLVISATPQEAS